jgi:hypothetical protein
MTNPTNLTDPPNPTSRTARRAVLPTALAALAATLVAAAPTAAAASSDGARPARPHVRVVHDGTGDVHRTLLQEPDLAYVDAPHRRLGDLTSLGVRNGRHAVRLTYRLSAMRRTGLGHGELAQVRTPRGTWDVTVLAYRPQVDSANGWRGEAMLWRPNAAGQARCAGLRHSISYRRDVVRVTVPSRCLGRPSWVRVRAAVTWLDSWRKATLDSTPGHAAEPRRWTAKVWR